MQKPLLAVLCTLLLPCSVMLVQAQSFPEQMGFVTSSPDNRTAKDFVQAVMMNNKFEIVTGKLALERSQDPAIRDYATHVIAAHRKIGTDMKRITDRSFVNRRVTPPPVFDPPHTKMHRALLVSYGPAFDRLYLSQQMQDHRELMATLEGYTAGKNGYPPLQQFARQTIPVTREHQAMLDRIAPAISGPVAAR
jgi:putative membrane protein